MGYDCGRDLAGRKVSLRAQICTLRRNSHRLIIRMRIRVLQQTTGADWIN